MPFLDNDYYSYDYGQEEVSKKPSTPVSTSSFSSTSNLFEKEPISPSSWPMMARSPISSTTEESSSKWPIIRMSSEPSDWNYPDMTSESFLDHHSFDLKIRSTSRPAAAIVTTTTTSPPPPASSYSYKKPEEVAYTYDQPCQLEDLCDVNEKNYPL